MNLNLTENYQSPRSLHKISAVLLALHDNSGLTIVESAKHLK